MLLFNNYKPTACSESTSRPSTLTLGRGVIAIELESCFKNKSIHYRQHQLQWNGRARSWGNSISSIMTGKSTRKSRVVRCFRAQFTCIWNQYGSSPLDLLYHILDIKSSVVATESLGVRNGEDLLLASAPDIEIHRRIYLKSENMAAGGGPKICQNLRKYFSAV